MSGLSAYYLSINRNKESIALDLATEEGAESVRILARGPTCSSRTSRPAGWRSSASPRADAEGEPAPRDRLHHRVRHAWARTRRVPGFDLLAQAGTGIMAITGEAGGGPAKVGVAVSDLARRAATPRSASPRPSAGASARARGRTSRRTSSASSLASLINVAQAALVTGQEAERHGNAHAQIVPYRPFTAADGDFVVAAGTDRQFARLAALLGQPGVGGGSPLPDQPRHGCSNRAAIEAAIDEILRREPRDAWLARLRQAGVPAGPVARAARSPPVGDGPGRSGPVRRLRAACPSSPLRSASAGHVPPCSFPAALDADGEKLRREFDSAARRKT